MKHSVQVNGTTVEIEFEVPSDLKRARDRKSTLQDEVETIQYQLSNKNRTDDEGNRLPSKKYHRWRHYAVKALLSKKTELRFLKRWIADRQQTLTAGKFDIDPDSDKSLLAAASNLLQEKIQEGSEFSELELELANLIRDRVLRI